MGDLDSDFYESEDPVWNPALLTIPMPGIRKMVNLASTMDDVIHLSIGQPDLPAPTHVVDATIAALQAGQTGYTMDAGLPELLEALSDYYGARYARELTPDNILITTGATEAIYLALTSTSSAGREFIIPEPSFMLYAPLVRMNGGTVKTIPTRAESNHQLDPQDVIDAIDANTCAIACLTLWLMSFSVIEGVRVHFLGVTALTLVLGWRFAIVAGSAAVVVYTLAIGESATSIPVSWLLTVAVPATVTRWLVHQLRNARSQNLFIYMLGAGFGGGALSSLAATVAAVVVLWLAGQQTMVALALENWPAALLLLFPEGFINGMIVSALTVFYPDLLKTFDDKHYLAG